MLALAAPNKLKAVNAKINHVRSQIKHDSAKQSQLQNTLEQEESHITHLQTEIQHSQRDIKALSKQQSSLTQDITDLNQQINKEQRILAKQIKSSYMLGKQPFIKLLLSGHTPEKQQRLLMYYQYFNQDRIDTIKQLQHMLTSLANKQQQLQDNRANLSSIISKQNDEKSALVNSQIRRKHVIKQLGQQIKTRQQQLSQLLDNQQRLQQAIQLAQRRKLSSNIKHQNFRTLKGKLPWPTKGKHQNLYGRHIDKSQLQWQGLVINAPLGQSIHAIANGKVVFAKWLPGYGKLIIVSHGKGYMTLYGRCHTLFKRVGDIVRQGETIASVGETGGFSQPGLYFAIRQNAKPLNPNRWCQRKQ